ncbi:MAG: hypothetical protein AAGI46_04590 [Planctomycetota bacterium]
MKRHLATLFCLAATAGVASADTITFDVADGYALGSSLVANPDWAGSGGLYSITSLGAGNGAAQSSNTDQANFANNRFTPSASFLGLPDTSTANRTFDFAFDLRSDQDATTSDFDVAHRIRIGGTDGAPIVDFQIFDNGRLQYFSGGGYSNVVNVNNNTVASISDFGSRFVPIAGTINVDAGTYSLSVDGVEQGTAIPLFSTPSTFGQVTLQWGTNSDDNAAGEYRQISLDNLFLEGSVIPEPAAVGAATLMGLLGLRRRR